MMKNTSSKDGIAANKKGLLQHAEMKDLSDLKSVTGGINEMIKPWPPCQSDKWGSCKPTKP